MEDTRGAIVYTRTKLYRGASLALLYVLCRKVFPLSLYIAFR